MQRFTELYKADAERLARYISERDNREIVMTTEDGDKFPTPPKMIEMPDKVNAFKVGNYEIAYLEQEGEDLKYKDRNLARVKTGDMIRAIRHERHMSLDGLSEKTGIKANNLASIEAGRYNIAVDTLYNICNALDYHFAFIPK